MKKILSIILIILTVSTLFSGCAKGSSPSPQDPVTLTMWHVYGSQTKSPLNDLINEFNQTAGKENGITVNVVSVTSSSAIDKALAASSNGEPGAESMPDMFTAYPRVAEIVGKENLLSWDLYFTKEELGAFRQNFLEEGVLDGSLVMLPIAKSTEAFYLNQTLFQRFSEETGVSADRLSSFEGVFDTARKYYDWSEGQSFLQINDYYNYAYIGMKAHGSELVRNGRLRLEDEAFEKIWEPLAKAAIYGGICLEDGYAASRWKTAEVIANTGSTADVLYQPTEVIYPDNSSEPITAVALPYPTFTETFSGVIYRGGGLFAVKSEDECKNRAAYVFAKWLTQDEINLSFVTRAGYLPVTTEGFDTLLSDISAVENENYHSVYRTVDTMMKDYTFCALPLYDNASELQLDFEKNVKGVLRSARNQYVKLTGDGEDPDSVLEQLVGSSLSELKNLSND